MQIDNVEPAHTVGCLMTAEQYLRLYEPGVIELMHDKTRAFLEDTERAAELAVLLGKRPSADGRYEAVVWALVYPC